MLRERAETFVVQATELFRLPQPQMAFKAHQCDLLSFTVGASTFVVVTSLCENRTQKAPTWIVKVTADPVLKFELVEILWLYHPRNLAIGPEDGGGRWLWFADHGPDEPPFPGGCSPLFWISEEGRILEKKDPLLDQPEFSFDGVIWRDPKNDDHFLYQSNIGRSLPKLLRWNKNSDFLIDESGRLPAEIVTRTKSFLTGRLISQDESGVELFMGADYSHEAQIPFESDLVLKVPISGQAEMAQFNVPKRLKDKTWSTVEIVPLRQGSKRVQDLFVIYHDFGFTEGTAEILRRTPKGSFERSTVPLPLPSLTGTETWISRATVGDLSGNGRTDIAIYFRSSRGPFTDSKSNLAILLEKEDGLHAYAMCQEAKAYRYFVGGFFVGKDFVQLGGDGVFELTSFSF